ncbi:MAG TPA: hypothetical protein VK843_23355 [Planctomycetota bacterium]|nr:hypothetical protein [Planctomycetota bacterium]
MGQGLVIAWSEIGRRAAVLAGMCVALVSLIQKCPLWVASARGAGTIVVVALIVHWIARLLAWSSEGDREENRVRVPMPIEPLVREKSPVKPGGPRG